MRIAIVGLLAGCVSTTPQHHRHAYAVDGAVLAAGVIVTVVGAMQLAACHHSNDANCSVTPTVEASLGGMLAFLGGAGAVANAAWAEWWPFAWNAPPPAQGWQRPSRANPPIATGGNQD